MAYLSNKHKTHVFILVWRRSKSGKPSMIKNLKEASNLYLKNYN